MKYHALVERDKLDSVYIDHAPHTAFEWLVSNEMKA